MNIQAVCEQLLLDRIGSVGDALVKLDARTVGFSPVATLPAAGTANTFAMFTGTASIGNSVVSQVLGDVTLGDYVLSGRRITVGPAIDDSNAIDCGVVVNAAFPLLAGESQRFGFLFANVFGTFITDAAVVTGVQIETGVDLTTTAPGFASINGFISQFDMRSTAYAGMIIGGFAEQTIWSVAGAHLLGTYRAFFANPFSPTTDGPNNAYMFYADATSLKCVNKYGLYVRAGFATGATTLAEGIRLVDSDAFFGGKIKVTGNTVGATVLVAPTNSPAVSGADAYTHIKFIAADGSTVWVPAYK